MTAVIETGQFLWYDGYINTAVYIIKEETMTNLFDLHMHTTASDGSDTPRELAQKIRGAGIRLFSVTDHDTIDGTLEMEKLVPEGVRFFRGVEFSCASPVCNCHILGYGFDPDHPALLAALEEGRLLRMDKLERRLKLMEENFGIVLTAEERSWLMSRNSPGKPHLGRILMDRGLCTDLSSGIRKYVLNVPGRDRIEAETAVRAIEAAGGISVWAHPLGGEGEKRLTAEQFEAQLETLLGYGIRGMECWYSRFTLEEVHLLMERAAEHGLIVTGGSDYHGKNRSDLHMGMLNAEGESCTIDWQGLSDVLTDATNMV